MVSHRKVVDTVCDPNALCEASSEIFSAKSWKLDDQQLNRLSVAATCIGVRLEPGL